MARKRQPWEIGDVFEQTLVDGSHSFGQIVGRERQALNSCSIVLFDLRVGANDATPSAAAATAAPMYAVLMATTDLLDRGTWRVVGRATPRISGAALPYESLRASGWVGAIIRGSGIVNEFASAFYGLTPWDDWHDPKFLDGMLVDPSVKPHGRLVYSKKT